MMNKHRMILSVIPGVMLVGAMLTLSGCNKEFKRTLYPTVGAVTFQGQPVIGGQVIFDCPAEGVTLAVLTDSNGKYVTKMADGEGLPAGEYTVSVKVYRPPPQGPGGTGYKAPPPPEGTPPGDTRKDIPAKYANGLLKFKVEAVKTNTFDIQLEP